MDYLKEKGKQPMAVDKVVDTGGEMMRIHRGDGNVVFIPKKDIDYIHAPVEDAPAKKP